MPTVDTTIVALIKNTSALTDYIGTNPARLMPDTIGNAVRPAIAYQRISNPRTRSLKTTSGLGRLRLQFTVFARSKSEREALVKELRLLLEPYADRNTGGVIDNILYDDARDQYDAATKDYLSFVDFIIWHVES